MIRVFLPAALFLISAFMSVLSLHAAWASGIVGLGLCAYSFARNRRSVTASVSIAQSPFTASLSVRTGIALLAAPVVTLLLVAAAMSGLFGRN